MVVHVFGLGLTTVQCTSVLCTAILRCTLLYTVVLFAVPQNMLLLVYQPMMQEGYIRGSSMCMKMQIVHAARHFSFGVHIHAACLSIRAIDIAVHVFTCN